MAWTQVMFADCANAWVETEVPITGLVHYSVNAADLSRVHVKYYRQAASCVAFLLGAGLCTLCIQVMASDNEAMAKQKFDPEIDLPDSTGRDLVLRACTKCHELGGLEAYKGYWGLPQWKAMVEDMVKNGAELQAAEQDVVAAYLTRHFGPDDPQ